MARKHEHELLNSIKGESIGKAWWNPDTEKIECSNQATMKMVFGGHSLHAENDLDLIRNLANAFKNGYITAKKVK